MTVHHRSSRRARGAFRLLGAGVAVAGLAFAGCGGDDESSSGDKAASGDTGKPVAITFIHAEPEGTFDAAIADFQKKNPTITVKQQAVPFDDLNTAIQSRVGQKDSSIDVYHADEPRVPAFAARGYLADLSDMKDDVAANVPQKAIDATSYDGKLYAVPQWTSTQLLYYNKKLLKKAGIEPPSADPTKPITWEQLTADAKKAQKAGARYGFTFDQVDRYYQLQVLPESLGGGPGLKGDGLLEPAVDTPGWQKSMEWYRSLFEDKVSPRGVAAEQTPALFSGGRAAYFVGGPWNVAAFSEAEKLEWGVAPHPYFEGGKAHTSTDSWAMAVSPFSKHLDASKKFAAYMAIDPDGARLSTSTNPNIPVQNEAYEEYLTRVSEQGGETTAPMADIIKESLATTAISRPRTIGWVDFETVMNKAFADIRNGSQPADRLGQASEELERVLAKLR